jgi:hypothetical protein
MCACVGNGENPNDTEGAEGAERDQRDVNGGHPANAFAAHDIDPNGQYDAAESSTGSRYRSLMTVR